MKLLIAASLLAVFPLSVFAGSCGEVEAKYQEDVAQLVPHDRLGLGPNPYLNHDISHALSEAQEELRKDYGLKMASCNSSPAQENSAEGNGADRDIVN